MAQKALSHPEASAWFDPHWQVINESTILYRDADGIVQQQRPDRVVTDGQRTIVVDYKTGRPHPQHQEQVAFYVDKLREMGYPEVCGYVWYIRHGNIVPVG
jgi:predicted RecB family nuclease